MAITAGDITPIADDGRDVFDGAGALDEQEDDEFIVMADILMPDVLPEQQPSEVAEDFAEPGPIGAAACGLLPFGWAAHGLLPSGWGASAVLSQEAHTFKAPSGQQHQAAVRSRVTINVGSGEQTVDHFKEPVSKEALTQLLPGHRPAARKQLRQRLLVDRLLEVFHHLLP